MKIEELFEGTTLSNIKNQLSVLEERWADEHPDVPLNSLLGIFQYRAEKQGFTPPTKQQKDKFVADVIKFKKENKMSEDEAINLAFSVAKLTKQKK